MTICWLLQFYFVVERPLIGIECLFVALIISAFSGNKFLRISLFSILFLPVLSLTVADVIAPSFGIPLRDFVLMAIFQYKAIPDLAKSSILLFFLYSLSILVLVDRLAASFDTSRHLITSGVCVVAIIAADIFLSANQLLKKDVIFFPNIVGGPILNMGWNPESGKMLVWPYEPKSFSSLKSLVKKDQRILSISFESLGIAKNENINQKLKEIILKSFPEYTLELDTMEEFKGGTLAGELRMLCGIMSYGNLVLDGEDKSGLLKNCIPQFYKENVRNNLTIAAHPNHGNAYNRTKIYPEVGFEKYFFPNAFKDINRNPCGNKQFVMCDEPFLRELAKEINQIDNDNFFIHLMTIDSHFPYSSNITKSNLTSDLLDYYFISIRSTADALKGFVNNLNKKPFYILLSGDHAPPFFDENARKIFYQNHVPVYILRRSIL